MPQVLWENYDCTSYIGLQHFTFHCSDGYSFVLSFSTAAAQRQYISLADMHFNWNCLFVNFTDIIGCKYLPCCSAHVSSTF